MKDSNEGYETENKEAEETENKNSWTRIRKKTPNRKSDIGRNTIAWLYTTRGIGKQSDWLESKWIEVKQQVREIEIRTKFTKKFERYSKDKRLVNKSDIRLNKTKEIAWLPTISSIVKQANWLQNKWIEVKQQVLKISHKDDRR